jgi:hypothetical protein
VAEGHFGHIAQIDRRAADLLEHDGADIGQALDQADAADQVLLGVLGSTPPPELALLRATASYTSRTVSW